MRTSKQAFVMQKFIHLKLGKHSAHACSHMEFIFLLEKLHGLLKKYKMFVKVNASSCYVLFTSYY